ncbi:nucleotide-binding protein [Anaeromyxobacter paludicola]|uniref:DNA-binding protein n=1 Tax=Anaeromyxobacter paludicola TaxID=2918171 RepID=A0ABN6NF06_9BACT|nr:nucleotide-binding protein [Anaeromyxobacter paludicola]BDG10635.1 hypothetical protein AMPC_37480 [Anaeromyxobacter paludicola]
MRLTLVAAFTLAMAACKQQPPPAKPAAGAAAPLAATDAAPAAGGIKGKLVERIDAAPYSYLKLDTAQGETWAAVPQTTAANGAEVTVVNAFPMKDFESKTLNRKFAVVYFGTLAGQEAAAGGAPMGGAPMGGAAAPAAMGGMPPQGMGGGMPPAGMGGQPPNVAAQHQGVNAAPVKVAKVAKATGPDARTVSEIYAQKASLKEKSVTVRGQVVKFNAGVMGKNWVHLRDGSGAEEKKDNDITVTTMDNVAVGDTVTAKGTVHLDKDFGYGYAYPVIVEEAKVSK